MKWKKFLFTKTRRRIALFVGQLLVLIACIAYIEDIYVGNILPDKQVKERFHQTDCFVIGKQLTTRGHILDKYRADFYVSYNVSGVQYTHWVTGNGLDRALSSNQSEQEDILSQFEVGRTYPCWYDPEAPKIAVLVLRHNWLSTFPLMVPSVVGLIVLYYFVKNRFHEFEAIMRKYRAMARKKKPKKPVKTRRV